MTMTCKAVRVRLPSIDDPELLASPMAAHIAACLRCQAEVARYRRLYRSLGSLAEYVEIAPWGLYFNVKFCSSIVNNLVQTFILPLIKCRKFLTKLF